MAQFDLKSLGKGLKIAYEAAASRITELSHVMSACNASVEGTTQDLFEARPVHSWPDPICCQPVHCGRVILVSVDHRECVGESLAVRVVQPVRIALSGLRLPALDRNKILNDLDLKFRW